MNKYSLSILLAATLTFPSFSLENPYASGGNQYGGDNFEAAQDNIYSQSANNQINNISTQSSNPSPNLGTSQLSNSPNTVSSSTSNFSSLNTADTSPQAVPASTSSGAPTKSGPWGKVDNWLHRRNVSPTGQPDMDLANQRIQAGKARIKAIKAREKLDKHIADCKLRTEELTHELQKAEDQALFIENQVKFQEANASSN